MSAGFSDFDRAMMARALALAEKGLYTATPNPRVGCVITQGERIVAEGWHERAGLPHAEALALEKAGAQAAGATVYVSLEPCNHFGRTPPCAGALINARVARGSPTTTSSPFAFLIVTENLGAPGVLASLDLIGNGFSGGASTFCATLVSAPIL